MSVQDCDALLRSAQPSGGDQPTSSRIRAAFFGPSPRTSVSLAASAVYSLPTAALDAAFLASQLRIAQQHGVSLPAIASTSGRLMPDAGGAVAFEIDQSSADNRDNRRTASSPLAATYVLLLLSCRGFVAIRRDLCGRRPAAFS